MKKQQSRKKKARPVATKERVAKAHPPITLEAQTTGHALATRSSHALATPLITERVYTPEQIELIKKTVAPGLKDDEFALYMYIARVRNLDPLQRQIHAVMRKVKNRDTGNWEERMTIQIGIDGFRSIANRSGLYMPSERPPLIEGAGTPEVRVTAWVKKWSPLDRSWHEFSGTALYREYVQTVKVDNKWVANSMWEKMPMNQTEKCAEAKALRRGWPEELGQFYIPEELKHDDEGPKTASEKKVEKEEAKARARRQADLLTPSQEPNRGHGNEGFDAHKDEKGAPASPQSVAASIPGVVMGKEAFATTQATSHAETSDADSEGQGEAQRSKLLNVVGGHMRKRGPKGQERQWLEVKLEDQDMNVFSVWCWHRSMFETLAQKPKNCVFILKQSAKSPDWYMIEDILSIDGVAWVKPSKEQTA